MKYIRLWLFALLVSHSMPVGAQVSALPSSDSEPFFMYEVKLIEEFIERFNDDPNSYIRQQCRELYGSDSIINRKKLLKSLFNKKQAWSSDTGAFIREVLNEGTPAYLNFTDSDWYAEVKCIFLYHNKKTEVLLVLHIRTEQGASKWMIAGIGVNQLPNRKANDQLTEKSPSGGFIPTSSYGTNFIVLSTALNKDIHAVDYFEPQLLSSPRAQAFLGLVKDGQLSFQYARSIKFYFLSVPGWVFTVEQFKRKNSNTGWLISNLQKLPNNEKDTFLKLLLYP